MLKQLAIVFMCVTEVHMLLLIVTAALCGTVAQDKFRSGEYKVYLDLDGSYSATSYLSIQHRKCKSWESGKQEQLDKGLF